MAGRRHSTDAMISVELFWPGMWLPHMTYPALPAVSGYLRAHGIDSRVTDLNIRYIGFVLSHRNIEQCRHIVRTRKLKARGSDYASMVLAEQLLNKYGRRFSSARRFFIDDASSRHIVNGLSQALGLIYNPFEISILGGSCTPNTFDENVLERYVTRDLDRNPFQTFLHRYVDRLPSRVGRVFGISLCGPSQMLFVYTLARLLKKRFSESKIVVGGSHLPLIVDALMGASAHSFLFKDVDAYVVGSGERPFLEYVTNLQLKKSVRAVHGMILKGKKKIILSSIPSEPLAAHQMAAPDWRSLAAARKLVRTLVYTVEITRGCHWARCTFCGSRQGANIRYCPIGVDTIIRNLKHLVSRHRAKHILFASLSAPAPLLEQLSLRLLDEGLHVKWRSWSTMTDELSTKRLLLFKKAGCIDLRCAPDSFNDALLFKMRKGTTGSMNKKVLLRMKRHGFSSPMGFIAGFPCDSVGNILRTIAFLKKYNMSAFFTRFFVPKGSYIARHPEQFHIRIMRSNRLDSVCAFKYLRRGDSTVVDRAFAKAKKAFSSNITYHAEPRSPVIGVDFSQNIGGNASDRKFPRLLQHVRLFEAEGFYWAFDAIAGVVYDLDESYYHFLRLCTGRSINVMRQTLNLSRTEMRRRLDGAINAGLL